MPLETSTQSAISGGVLSMTSGMLSPLQNSGPPRSHSRISQVSEVSRGGQLADVKEEFWRLYKKVRRLNIYTKDELSDYVNMFLLMDEDNDGTINAAGLGDAAKKLGMNLDMEEAAQLVKEADSDGNGEIDFEEFCGVMKKMSAKQTTWEEVVRQCFEVFDRSGNGVITEEHFQEVLFQLGGISDASVISDVFAEVDVDGSGQIDYEEFAAFVRSYLQDSDVDVH